MLKRLLTLLGAGLAILLVVLIINTITFSSKQVYESVIDAPTVTDSSLLRLQQAIRFKTISHSDLAHFDSAEFRAFHKFLVDAYPLVHNRLDRQLIAGVSLLYKWEGTDRQLNPIVLMAHQDVVPIEEASRDLWTVDPFEPVIKDEWIWGRGTADDKINLISILEVVEKLLLNGFIPRRTIYLAFGHDEEVGGTGAQAIAEYLKSQNISADLVLDEGGIVTLDKVPGMMKPVALLGTAEKGYLSLELSVEKHGGHSSMPEHETAMDILSRALVAIHEHPFEAGFSEPTEGFIDYIGPELPFFQKMVFANKWLLGPVIISIYEQTSGGNALVRTTSAPTIFHAGIKDNVIPSRATATVNLRLLPGDPSQKVIARIKEIIHDESVQITPLQEFIAEPSRVTSTDGYGFDLVARTVRKTLPETVVTPFLMIGGTDSRHMEIISTQIIKFSPMTDPIGFHGIDERVSIKSYRDTMWFYENLLRTANAE